MKAGDLAPHLKIVYEFMSLTKQSSRTAKQTQRHQLRKIISTE